MSNEHEKEPIKKAAAPQPVQGIPGGGNLPVMPNFNYQPSATATPSENTTSVEIKFEPLPGKTGWTWTAWASNFTGRTNGSVSNIPTGDRGFTQATALTKASGSTYFGVYVKCTKSGETDETEGTLYSWADGSVQTGWDVTTQSSNTEMKENKRS